jgi:hypothetical protein
MAEFATLTGFESGLHLVTRPTVLVKDDFGAEAFVRDVANLRIVALVAGPRFEIGRAGIVVTSSAIDPKIVEVLFVGRVERHRVGFVVALVALDLHILDVLYVGEDQVAHDRRGSWLQGWCGVFVGSLNGLRGGFFFHLFRNGGSGCHQYPWQQCQYAQQLGTVLHDASQLEWRSPSVPL